MAQHVDIPRWVAPPHARVHPRLALVRHDDRLFSYADMLRHTPFEFALADVDGVVPAPQDWWDDLLRRAPDVARSIAKRCEPRDFEVLDLFAAEVGGSA